MWEEMGDFESKVLQHSKDVAAKTNEATEAINNTLNNFAALKSQFDKIDTYYLERFLETVRSITNLSEPTKDMICF
jgi:hypothetical protein